MKVLVTGGTGFIGSHLVQQLLKAGVETKVFDNLSSSSNENISLVTKDTELINSDIRDLDSLVSSIDGIDTVFHLAAITSIPESIKNPISVYDVNVRGTLNVLWAASQANVSRVIIASSCSVYGDIHQSPLRETYLPNPRSPYAASKLTSESLAESFYHSYGLEVVCLRYFNVYGLRQQTQSGYAAVIPNFVECYHQKKPPQIYGAGKQSRDFIHVSDVAKANILAATLPSEILREHRVFNVGTGNKTNLLELLELISTKMSYYLEPDFLPSRQGEIEHSCADVSLAQEKLGFQPIVSLEKGIESLL